MTEFDYSSIPKGYYDKIAINGFSVRKSWHLLKFKRICDYLSFKSRKKILDIGCFAGTFLSILPQSSANQQLGVDIIEDQINYANENYQTNFRHFRFIKNLEEINNLDQSFDCVTMIEVIEHLKPEEIYTIFNILSNKIITSGGCVVITTPNYLSFWPILELIIDRVSSVKYSEQHLVKFTYFNIISKLKNIYPNFDLEYKVVFKTTSHFIAPFLAIFGQTFANRIADLITPESWKFPFGNLIFMVIERR